jgi:hypothetical protein
MIFSLCSTIGFSLSERLLEGPDIEFVRADERMLAMQMPIHVGDRIDVQ